MPVAAAPAIPDQPQKDTLPQDGHSGRSLWADGDADRRPGSPKRSVASTSFLWLREHGLPAPAADPRMEHRLTTFVLSSLTSLSRSGLTTLFFCRVLVSRGISMLEAERIGYTQPYSLELGARNLRLGAESLHPGSCDEVPRRGRAASSMISQREHSPALTGTAANDPNELTT